MAKSKTAITPTREQDYPEWYQQVVKHADMAETSPVRGCMVIKPWGYALWENMQRDLDARFKATGHQNFYCPLFIPKSFLEKEADHVDGFAKECAVVTHKRLVKAADGKLEPAGELEEPLIVRPTSETIIGDAFSNWIQSHRDLPLKLNQWANIVRWEMRTRLFLRTTEFLWQEGHTAHADRTEAEQEAMTMLDVYAEFAETMMAMPVIKGEKSESERFPGAENTFCIEAMMQDGKALQAGTSHFLGQNFAKAFDIKYASKEGQEEYVWTTSWGVSTRLIGGLIMTHSDDNGLVLPPRLAPIHVVILPIIRDENDKTIIEDYCEIIQKRLANLTYAGQPIQVNIDHSDNNPGVKAWSWYKKGVPVRIEIGKREYESNTVCLGRRDLAYKDKVTLELDECMTDLENILEAIQTGLYDRALAYQQANSKTVTSEAEFYDFFKNNRGFAYGYWAENAELEQRLQADLKVSIRCIPLATQDQTGSCLFTGKPGAKLAVFAKAY